MTDVLTVKHRPCRPLVVFDGDCDFCRRQVQRWQTRAAGRIDFAAYQQLKDRYPELSVQRCRRALQLIEPDGSVYQAAHAVLRAAAHLGRTWPMWLYDRLPGCARSAEAIYRLIARQRKKL